MANDANGKWMKNKLELLKTDKVFERKKNAPPIWLR